MTYSDRQRRDFSHVRFDNPDWCGKFQMIESNRVIKRTDHESYYSCCFATHTHIHTFVLLRVTMGDHVRCPDINQTNYYLDNGRPRNLNQSRIVWVHHSIIIGGAFEITIYSRSSLVLDFFFFLLKIVSFLNIFYQNK